MATVVVTFFLFVRFYVYKMDADWLESQRDQFLSQREKRWSMNSQRLEEIVAELMKPISNDGRRSFDTDLSALLEEYLTEAGLHALEADEDAPSPTDLAAPNFTEIALLLQQSATIYGRKVDFLYKHVLSVSDSLLTSTQELANSSAVSEEPQTPTSSAAAERRKRKASTAGEFDEISLEPGAGAAREAEAPRPPPTLARMYLELEPRVVSAADVPLFDYSAENVGLLSDFQVAWRLHEGLLVDELEGGSASGDSALRPISLLELQAAIEAAAPPSPPPLREESPARERSPSPSPPLAASTPLPCADPPDPRDLASGAVVVKRERKRRSDVKVDDIFDGSVKILFGKDLMRKLKEVREFSIDEKWISKVVHKRKVHILNERKRLIGELDDLGEPDDTRPPDKGFPGWSGPEGARARAALGAAAAGATAPRADDSDDDDGFFEQSSGGSSVQSAEPDAPTPAQRQAQAEIAAWKASILCRAAAAEARGTFDVHALGARVLGALPPTRARPVRDLLREHAHHETDVSRLVLAALFLANAGNVEIEQGPPLSLGSFSLRLVSSDLRRYGLVVADERLAR